MEKEKLKSIKISQTIWLKLMNVKNKHHLKSAEQVIITYQKIITRLNLHKEFEEEAKLVKGEK